MGACTTKPMQSPYKIAVATEVEGRYSLNVRRFDWLARGPKQPHYDSLLPEQGKARAAFTSCFPAGQLPRLGPVIGKGAFGEVHLSSDGDGRYYAVKVLEKRDMASLKGGRDRVANEVDVMKKLRHPFIAHLFWAYQDKSAVYLVLEYAVGGELFHRLRQAERFSEDQTKFYAAQISCALSYLHSLRIVYRDLKPENLMLDEHGNIKLIDMGFAEELPPDGFLTEPVGTTMYLAPEMATAKDAKRRYGFGVDWWACGCVIYEMLLGVAPFGDQGEDPKFEILAKIEAAKVSYPQWLSEPAMTLVAGLLNPIAEKRFAFQQVQGSAWFSDVQWASLINGCIKPPWRPADEGPGGTSNFLDWAGTTGAGGGGGASKKQPPGGGGGGAKATTSHQVEGGDSCNLRDIPWAPGTSASSTGGGSQHQLLAGEGGGGQPGRGKSPPLHTSGGGSHGKLLSSGTAVYAATTSARYRIGGGEGLASSSASSQQNLARTAPASLPSPPREGGGRERDGGSKTTNSQAMMKTSIRAITAAGALSDSIGSSHNRNSTTTNTTKTSSSSPSRPRPQQLQSRGSRTG